MEYKLTFEDGSEALMHHGIKGMHWGVWNAETAARYGGGSGVRKRRDKRIAKNENKAKNASDSDKKMKYQRKADFSKELKSPNSTKLSSGDLRGKRNLHAVATALLAREALGDAIGTALGGITLASVAPKYVASGYAYMLGGPIAGLAATAAVGTASGIAAVGQYKRAKSYHRTAIAKDNS